ncbi:MAG TPA: enoyl-CoA hydratase-related protein [Aggregatilineales bacterium]|jgi:enoyl-CoA hydratase/carnithine racemase|nr:enoyl-CoA hydratase-related protein [Aggregatilineales bacterium]
MTPPALQTQVNGSVATLTLNRPDVRNAMSHRMVEEIITFFETLRDDRSVRAVVIAATGRTFCAGGDFNDLLAEHGMESDERLAIMARFDHMLRTVNEAPQVTIARVQGGALGGGFGLVCVTDIAIAADNALFSLPEVRMGLAPALISPYVIQRIGLTSARRLMLTGGHLSADEALRCGVVHEVVPADGLDARIDALLAEVRLCAPNALAETKRLIFEVSGRPPDATLDYRAALITRLRASEEGQEGISAFLGKRKPSWADRS